MAIDRGFPATDGGVEFVMERVKDYPEHRLSLFGQGDCYPGKILAANIGFRPIERIDNPGVGGIRPLTARLLADNRMVRKITAEDVVNRLVGESIHIRNDFLPRFMGNFEGLIPMPKQHMASSPGGVFSNLQKFL